MSTPSVPARRSAAAPARRARALATPALVPMALAMLAAATPATAATPTRTLTLEVRDDGQGLAAAPTASHKLSGLALMQRHAHEIQGKLELHSEPGQGTRVSCTVPLASQPKPADL